MTSAFGENVLFTTALALALGVPKIDWGTGRWSDTDEAHRIVLPTADQPLLRVWLFEGIYLAYQYKHDGVRGNGTLTACHVLREFINRPTSANFNLLLDWAGIFLHDLHRDATALDVVRLELLVDIEDMYAIFDVVDPDTLSEEEAAAFITWDDEDEDEEEGWEDETEEEPATGFYISETIGIVPSDPLHAAELAAQGFEMRTATPPPATPGVDKDSEDETEEVRRIRHQHERKEAIERIEARNNERKTPGQRVVLFGPDGKELL